MISRFLLSAALRRIALVYAILSATVIFSQEPLPVFVPPSPNAQAFAAYSNIPVSLYTGKPDIGVDLLNLKSGSLTFPVNIQYDATGIKVEDIASRIGLKWILNCGGIITRSVVGLADETPNWGFNTRWDKLPVRNNGGIHPMNDSLRYIYIGHWDAEPDIYTFNFGNQSGRFTSAGDSYCTQPVSNLKIETYTRDLVLRFKITDENGIEYYFEDAEITNTSIGEKPFYGATAWYLTRIVNPATGDLISLQYGDYNFTHDFPYSESKTVLAMYSAECISTYPGITFSTIEQQYINAKLLTGVTGNGWQLSLSYSSRSDINDKKLDSISLTDTYNNYFIKSVLFNYSYYAGNKLRLDSVGIRGNALQRINHQFTYNSTSVAAVASKSQDHWGYNNGAGNATLIPDYLDYLGNLVMGGNRSPNPSIVTEGMLSQITYPTGGSTMFNFESNEYSSIKSGVNDGPQYNEFSKSEELIVQFGAASQLVKQISIPYKQRVSITYYIANCIGGPYSSPCRSKNALPPSVLLRVIGAGINQAYTSNLSNTGKGGTQTFMLEAGTYTLEGTAPEVNDFGRLLIVYKDYDYDNPIKKWPGGGVRVRNITTSDGGAVDKRMTRTFTYDDKVDPGKTSGILITKPVYVSYLNKYTSIGGGTSPSTCGFPCPLRNYTSYSQAALGVSGGGYVVYPRAEEIMGTLENNSGKIEYWFSGPYSISLLGPPFLRVSQFWKDGLPLGKTIYNDLGQKLKEEHSFYSFDTITDRPSRRSLNVYPKALCDADAVLENGDYMNSEVYVERYYSHFEKLKHRIDTVFIYNPLNLNAVVMTWSKTFFDDNDNANPTRIQTTDSKGSLKTSYLRYAGHFTGNEVYDAMKARNMIGSVIKNYDLLNETQELSAKEIQYAFFGDKILPAQMRSAQMGNPLETDIIIDEYDASGHVKQTTQKGLVRNFIWDDLFEYPVAAAENTGGRQIAYTSFETTTKGNWNYGGTSINTSAFTGNNAYSLTAGSVSIENLDAQATYVISFWRKNDGGIAYVSAGVGTEVCSRKGWTLIRYQLSGNNTFDLSGNAIIDELRLHPLEAHMNTYTFNPLVGVTASIDPDNKILNYEYDGLNRLVLVRDQDGNILKKICYSYSGQQSPCPESSGVIYAKLELENFYSQSINTGLIASWGTVSYADLRVSFYADAACLIPVSVTDKTINVLTTTTTSPQFTSPIVTELVQQYNFNGNSFLLPDVVVSRSYMTTTRSPYSQTFQLVNPEGFQIVE